MKVCGVECKKVDPAVFEEFCKAMKEEVIPEVERILAARAEAWHRRKYGLDK